MPGRARANGAGRRGHHGVGGDLAPAYDPDVRDRAAALHGDGGGVGRAADAGEAAGHDAPAVGRAGEEDAQAHRARHEAAVLPGGGGGERDGLLAHEIGAVGFEKGVDRVARDAAEFAAQHRALVDLEGQAGRERGADHHRGGVGADMVALGRLAAPPGRDVGQKQLLVAQRAGDLRHEGQKRAGFQNAGAERVDQRDVAAPHGADHAGRAEARGGVEFERVGEGRVEAAPEHVDRREPRDRADHDAAVLDREVLAFEQHEAEIAGDPGVLVIGVVHQAGREDADAAVAVGAQALERVAEGAEEAGEAVDAGLGEEVGENPRRRHAVLQREAGAGRGLGAVAEHPPGAVGAATDLEGEEVQEVAGGGFRADHRAEPFGAGGDQGRGQMTVRDEPVFAVEIGAEGFEQVGALDQAARDLGPVGLLDQDRDVAERPGPLGRGRAVVFAEEHARVAQVLVAAPEPLGEVRRRQRRQMVDELPPDRADRAVRPEQLVRDAGRRRVVREDRGHRVAGSVGGRRHQIPGARRRSRVIGNSRCGVSGVGTYGLGVWPFGSKRARRRASASLPLTGKVS